MRVAISPQLFPCKKLADLSKHWCVDKTLDPTIKRFSNDNNI